MSCIMNGLLSFPTIKYGIYIYRLFIALAFLYVLAEDHSHSSFFFKPKHPGVPTLPKSLDDLKKWMIEFDLCTSYVINIQLYTGFI